jgi:hypothetical protein
MLNRRGLIIILIIITLLLSAKFAQELNLISSAGAASITLSGQNSGEKSPNEIYFEKIKELLNLTETGRKALALMAQYEVALKFDHNHGTIYHVPSNTMIIDADQNPVWAAINFVHEMNHALYLHQGLRADIHGLSREEYVRQKIDEEAQGIVLSIEAKTELWKAGVDVIEFNYPLEEAYREAYLIAVETALAQEAGQEVGDLLVIGRDAGIARVVEGLMAGEVWRSSSRVPYPDYFAKDWGKANFFGPLSRFVADLVESTFS